MVLRLYACKPCKPKTKQKWLVFQNDPWSKNLLLPVGKIWSWEFLWKLVSIGPNIHMTLFRLRSSSNSSWVRIHASKSWCLCHKRISKHQYLSREIHLHSNTSHLQKCLKQKHVKHWPSLQVMLAKHTRACSSESALPNLSGDNCWHNYLHQRHGYYWTVMLVKSILYIYIHIIWLVSGLPSKTSSISNIDSIHVSFVVSVPLPFGG